MDDRIAARIARKSLQRPIRLLGVFPRPRTETTLLLDALAEAGDVDLTVLYGATAPAAVAAEPPGHAHGFPRSVRVSRIDRLLGRDYPINWAIWNSCRTLRPDCMIIAGWSTFATQAAIVWCVARRVPFLLLEEGGRVSPADVGGRPHFLVGAVYRSAAAVLPGLATDESMIPREVNGERYLDHPKTTDATAARVRDLAAAPGTRA